MDKDDRQINNATALMERYVEICNESLAQNNNSFPFKQILAAARDAQKERCINVLIPNVAACENLLLCLNEEVTLITHPELSQNQNGTWVVDLNYIKGVIDNAAEYIANPAKIDWEWLY
tara:strand:- start:375 stop:731 length:357 start_codon:yes stop_codon:yes gene_type:complete